MLSPTQNHLLVPGQGRYRPRAILREPTAPGNTGKRPSPTSGQAKTCSWVPTAVSSTATSLQPLFVLALLPIQLRYARLRSGSEHRREGDSPGRDKTGHCRRHAPGTQPVPEMPWAEPRSCAEGMLGVVRGISEAAPCQSLSCSVPARQNLLAAQGQPTGEQTASGAGTVAQ